MNHMDDHTIHFELNKSAEQAGYDFAVSVPGGNSVFIARNIPDVRAALTAIAEAFTAPLVDKDRLDLLEESSSAISGLLDRVTELERGLDASKAQLDETNKAMIRMLAGGNAYVSVPQSPTSGALAKANPRSQPTTTEGPRHTEAGFAGTFRRPLSEAVPHRDFPGGAFRPGGRVAAQPAGSMIDETDE